MLVVQADLKSMLALTILLFSTLNKSYLVTLPPTLTSHFMFYLPHPHNGHSTVSEHLYPPILVAPFSLVLATFHLLLACFTFHLVLTETPGIYMIIIY